MEARKVILDGIGYMGKYGGHFGLMKVEPTKAEAILLGESTPLAVLAVSDTGHGGRVGVFLCEETSIDEDVIHKPPQLFRNLLLWLNKGQPFSVAHITQTSDASVLTDEINTYVVTGVCNTLADEIDKSLHLGNNFLFVLDTRGFIEGPCSSVFRALLSSYGYHIEQGDVSGVYCPVVGSCWTYTGAFLMAGVAEVIVHEGCVPGTLIVHGDNAHPVLRASGSTDLLCAVAEVGRGRIAVFCHDSYFRDITANDINHRFQANVLQWLAQKTINMTTDVAYFDSVNDLNKPVIILHGDIAKSNASTLETFVRKGGGLVISCTPWGWKQITGATDIRNMGSHAFLLQAGIRFTDSYFYGLPVVVEDRKLYHFGEALKTLVEDPSTICECGPVVATGLRLFSVNDQEQMFKDNLESLTNNLQKFPCSNWPCDSGPVSDLKEKTSICLLTELMQFMRTPCMAPGIDKFLGNIPHDAPCVNECFNVHSSRQEYIALGLYLPPSYLLKVKVTNVKNNEEWYLRVGAHSDNLTNCAKFKRWPSIVKYVAINENCHTWSPYGGLLYLKSPANESSISFELDGAVKSPFYQVTTSSEDWLRIRQYPGPWADLEGQYIRITLPSSSLRDADNPADTLRFWDNVVMAHHELRSTSPKNAKKEWIVCDVQPSCGYMHSGYPIVTNLDISEPDRKSSLDPFILDSQALQKNGAWGLFHELGHNMQLSDWTFKGTVEVTCNIFTLHAMDILVGKPVWVHSRLLEHFPTVRQYFLDGALFAQWKEDPFLALCVYAQLAHHFGWSSYKKVFALYEAAANKNISEEEKITLWILRFSQTVGQNLCPLFHFWGFPLTGDLQDKLVGLPPFLPEDEMTQLNLERHQTIRAAYQ